MCIGKDWQGGGHICSHKDASDLLKYVPYELDKYAIDKELSGIFSLFPVLAFDSCLTT
jgi:hypothetical protein